MRAAFALILVAGSLLFWAGIRSDSAGQAFPKRAVVPAVARDAAQATAPATSTPTATPTATPTPSPTPTTPAQGACPAGQVCVRNVSWYTSSTGTIHVVGEVLNSRPVPVRFVRISVGYYSSAGTLLATDFGFADVDVILAGGDSPFDVLLLSPPPGIASVQAVVSSYSDTTVPPGSGDLSSSVSNVFRSSIGTLHLVGTARNASATLTHKFVQVYAAFYGPDGRVQAVDFTFTSPSDLIPGGAGTFDLLVLDPPAYSSYRIWVTSSSTVAGTPAGGGGSGPVPGCATVCVRKMTMTTSSSGTVYVSGEVVNGRPNAVRFVEITADFYSSAGQLLATDFTFSSVSVLGPGQDSPFQALLFSAPPGIASFQARVTDYSEPSSEPPVSGLTASVTNTYTSAGGILHIVGTVQNGGSLFSEFVEVITALYDANGNVVDVDFTFTSPSDLAAGQSGTFDALYFSPPAYSTYRVWVDANQ